MSSLIHSNGPTTEDTTGDQGWEEAQRENRLQLQACEAERGATRQKREYIVYIENASNIRGAFIVKQVSTVNELFQGIYERYPKLSHEAIVMRVSDSRTGSMHRIFYEQELPQHTDCLYVQLSLRKHTSMAGGKIEKQ